VASYLPTAHTSSKAIAATSAREACLVPVSAPGIPVHVSPFQGATRGRRHGLSSVTRRPTAHTSFQARAATDWTHPMRSPAMSGPDVSCHPGVQGPVARAGRADGDASGDGLLDARDGEAVRVDATVGPVLGEEAGEHEANSRRMPTRNSRSTGK
jgi:hypothetical protein